MDVIKYFINIIFTKNCIPNLIAQFYIKIMYTALVKVSYNSSFTFTWLCLHAYIFQLYYLSIVVRQTIYDRV